ncbi:MAG: hypothetical protein P4L71_01325 [Acetobacteraceae bacterium]|nr:hypothetical protein [Acetobacteraceae bacterium]
MDNGLQDVISAAVSRNGPKMGSGRTGRRAPQLSVVETESPAAQEAEAATIASTETTSRTAPAGGSSQLGDGGLRLAFWVCAFHDALMKRRAQGEELTENEEYLLELSPKDFAGIRPLVIDMTLGRLAAVVNAPDLPTEFDDLGTVHQMEVFALTTLRNLSSRARQTFETDGPDAALSLFGQSAEGLDPLAIFRLVFTTALDLVESFERIIPADAMLLSRLAEALDSEVDRI